jgi:hypothetical protein
MDDAQRSFDGVLAVKPTNVVALLGKVVYIAVQSLHTNENLARRQFSTLGATSRKHCGCFKMFCGITPIVSLIQG